MSYRSKRTWAQVKMEDDSQEIKKPASPLPKRPLSACGAGERWGPFGPLNGGGSQLATETLPHSRPLLPLQQPEKAQVPLQKPPTESSKAKPSLFQPQCSILNKPGQDKIVLTQSSQRHHLRTLSHEISATACPDKLNLKHTFACVVPGGKENRPPDTVSSNKATAQPQPKYKFSGKTPSNADEGLGINGCRKSAPIWKNLSTGPLKANSSVLKPQCPTSTPCHEKHNLKPFTASVKEVIGQSKPELNFGEKSPSYVDESTRVSKGRNSTPIWKNHVPEPPKANASLLKSQSLTSTPLSKTQVIGQSHHGLNLSDKPPSNGESHGTTGGRSSTLIWKRPATEPRQTNSSLWKPQSLESTPCLEKPNLSPTFTCTLKGNQDKRPPTHDWEQGEVAENVDTSSRLPEVASSQGKDGIIGSNTLKPFKPRRRNLIPDWPDDVEFDEKEEVLTIDPEGKYEMVRGSIQPHDVWHANGLKYFVNFNDYYQPIRKGGHILVKFLGDVAETERFCPIRETNWHHVDSQYKVDIIDLVRGHFVIPDGDCFDQGILKRTGRSLRQYRHQLKSTFFKPKEKTKKQILDAGPKGHPRDSWISLVNYWYSEKGEKYAECGKEARASQNHVHVTGATSYADVRADFEDENKIEPSEIEIFERTHRCKKDGSFVKDTMTEDLLIDVEANVHTAICNNPSSTKSRVEFENEAFCKLMYGDETPSRPVGYGFGVKGSDISGVRGIRRKELFKSGTNNNLAMLKVEKVVSDLAQENKELVKQQSELLAKYDENNKLLKVMTTQFGHFLEKLSSGEQSTQMIDLAKTVLNMANSANS